MIDLMATKERFKADGRKFQTYAIARGYNPATWTRKMCGLNRFTEAELQTMREDGLLVETLPEANMEAA